MPLTRPSCTPLFRVFMNSGLYTVSTRVPSATYDSTVTCSHCVPPKLFPISTRRPILSVLSRRRRIAFAPPVDSLFSLLSFLLSFPSLLSFSNAPPRALILHISCAAVLLALLSCSVTRAARFLVFFNAKSSQRTCATFCAHRTNGSTTYEPRGSKRLPLVATTWDTASPGQTTLY